MPKLLFSRGSTPFFQVRLKSSTTKIGRAETCDVVLGEPQISREHAAVYALEGQYFIKRIGRSRLQVNGMEQESQLLKENDRIQIGPWEAVFSNKTAMRGSESETQYTLGNEERTQILAGDSKEFLVKDLKIKIQQAGRSPRIVPFPATSFTIGADSKNELVLEDPYVSSRHLKLRLESGTVWVYDMGSTNGTFLGSAKIREAQWEVGETLKLGQCQLQLMEAPRMEEVRPVEVKAYCDLLGSSTAMRKLYGSLERVGPIDATVLILGESGSGKELVARGVHRLSSRRQGPFIALNCGAISPELMESELFGHEKGAFTGAAQRHEGAFAQARGGTLFLDEIGELPLNLQPKLLRVLENKSYRMVGGNQEIMADVRVVAATHRNLEELVKAKKFREDLFFRLFVLPLYLPPLRERLEDLPLLAQAFLQEFSPNGRPKQLNEAALKKLMDHDFPGNVRELRNILLRAVVLSEGGALDAETILFPQQAGENQKTLAFSGREKLEEMESKLFLKALMAHDWNKAKAAESLGIAKSTLFAKIKLYGLEDPRK